MTYKKVYKDVQMCLTCNEGIFHKILQRAPYIIFHRFPILLQFYDNSFTFVSDYEVSSLSLTALNHLLDVVTHILYLRFQQTERFQQKFESSIISRSIKFLLLKSL